MTATAPPRHRLRFPSPGGGEGPRVDVAVTDVQKQGISRLPADETIAGLQHVVTLHALGEDNLGDELRVI